MDSAADFRQSAFLFVLGVFSGSALWWLTLSAGVHYLRGLATTTVLVWVNRIAGAAIVVFGALMAWRGFSQLVTVS